MDENELRILLEKEDVTYEDEDEDLNGNEKGILSGILQDFESHEGSGSFVSNYKVLLRILEDPSKVSSNVLVLALKVLCEGLTVAHDEVKAGGEDVTKLSREQWKAARKSTITLLFLFYKAVTNIESKFFAEQHNLSVVAAVQANRRKPKKGAGSDNSNYPFWDEYRQRLLVHMNRLLKCPIEKIWPSEANFFRGITLAVCTVIANPAAKLIRNPDLVNDLFNVLGQLCCRYEEESGVINRLVPMIKNSEDVAKIIAQGLHRLHSEYERSRVVFTAVKEVLQMYNNQLERETPAERSVAAFLHEISVVCPKGTINALPFIMQFLESESSSIRGAVLSVAAELLRWSKVPDASLEVPATQNDGEIDFDSLRDDVLHHLILHARDTNALVRNKVLQLCTNLISEGNLYLPEILTCAEQGKARLMDKAVTTRKYAINLLSAAVYSDPIVIKFSAADFKLQIRELRKELVDFLGQNLSAERKLKTVVKEFITLVGVDDLSDLKLPPEIGEPEAALKHIETLLKDGKFYEACKFLYLALQEFVQHPDFKPFEKEIKSQKMYITFFKKLLNLTVEDSDDEGGGEGEIEDMGVLESDQCKAKRHYIKYIENCHGLATIMEASLPSLTILLELGTSGDKTEVIEYLAVLTESGYKLDERVTGGIIDAVAQMDAASRTELIEAVWRIFLKGCDTESSVITRLFSIMGKLSTSQRESMGILIDEMVKNQSLAMEHFQILWDAFGLTNPNWKSEESKFAIYILGIVGRTHRSVITSNLNYLIDVGLGPRGLQDFQLVQNTCEAFMLLCPKPSKNVDEDISSQDTSVFRFPVDHELYEKLCGIILYGLSVKSVAATDHSFQKVSELILQLIYRTCSEPKKIVLDLLSKVHAIVFGERKQTSQIKQTERILCRYLNLVTALLGAHVFYFENVVLTEVKRRKKQASNRSSKGKQSSKKASKANKSVARSRNTTAANITTESTLSNATANGDASEVNEMDVIIGNIGYDAELEAVRGYLERILNEAGTFRQMRTHTLFVCSRLEKYESLLLKVSAVRALAKIMSISSMSVARNADTFMGLWANSKSPVVKCELVRAAILLNVRYPNQMENCNQSLLLGLQDEHDSIKMAALDFITFLALNDLVKIRDQLTEVAVCLIDENHDVREMAKDFLEQCGEKDNMLSNALPDILSRLSSREMDQDSYQQIMKFLLERVKKDRMLLGFVEKLILRFRVAPKGRQCQDVAFCLHQLTYNDKSFKIIKENFNSYHDKLGDEYVFDAFNTIAANLRKTAKQDFKLKLDEYEKELVVARAKCIEKDRLEEAAVRKAVVGAPPDSSDSEMEEQEEPEGEENVDENVEENVKENEEESEEEKTEEEKMSEGEADAEAETKSEEDSDDHSDAESGNIKPKVEPTN